MKICTKCKVKKEVLNFYKDNTKKDWLTSSCKICKNRTSKKYYRSINGLVSLIYSREKQSSIKRWHSVPKYTKKELLEWILSQDNFENMYNNWIKNWYNVSLTPSIDRLDDYKWYSFDNIQLITWKDNNHKAHLDRKNWINNKINKAVLQYSEDWEFIKEYFSIRSACRITWAYRCEVCSCCKWKIKTAWGFIRKYK